LPADHTDLAPGGSLHQEHDLRMMIFALGRIIEVLKRFGDSTVVFVTEDDSQSGWDHVSDTEQQEFVNRSLFTFAKSVHYQL